MHPSLSSFVSLFSLLSSMVYIPASFGGSVSCLFFPMVVFLFVLGLWLCLLFYCLISDGASLFIYCYILIL